MKARSAGWALAFVVLPVLAFWLVRYTAPGHAFSRVIAGMLRDF